MSLKTPGSQTTADLQSTDETDTLNGVDHRLEETVATASPRPGDDDLATNTRTDASTGPDDPLTVTTTVCRKDAPILVVRKFHYVPVEETVVDVERGYVDGVEVYSVERDTAEWAPHFMADVDGFDHAMPFIMYARLHAFSEPAWTVGRAFSSRVFGSGE